MVKNITPQALEWAQQHDWFKSSYVTDDGHIAIWATENGKVHPWPFLNLGELRNWAGY